MPRSTQGTQITTSAQIDPGVIVNSDINSSAAIAYSKLAALTDGNVLIGNGSNVAVSVSQSGDVTFSNTGVAAIGSGVVVDADLSSSAAVAYSKLAALTSANLLIGSASNVATVTAVTGDVTISNSGVTAIGADKVTETMMATDAIGLTELKAGTDGEIYTFDTSGNPAFVAVGTSAQVLTSNGAGAAPTMQDAPGGAWTLVEKISPSAASTVSFSSITARNLFLLVFEIKVSADCQFNMTFNSDTGSNYEYHLLNGTSMELNTAQGKIVLSNGQDADDTVSGMFLIGGKKATGDMLSVSGSSTGQDGDTTNQHFGGIWDKSGETAISAILITATAGNFTGTAMLYFNTSSG